jgi:hypothetical protein
MKKVMLSKAEQKRRFEEGPLEVYVWFRIRGRFTRRQRRQHWLFCKKLEKRYPFLTFDEKQALGMTSIRRWYTGQYYGPALVLQVKEE